MGLKNEVYFIDKEHLSNQIYDFYEYRYYVLKNTEKLDISRDEIMEHANNVLEYILEESDYVTLKRSDINEWSGLLEFKPKNQKWYFAVKYIQMEDNGIWVVVDCHHEALHHNNPEMKKKLRIESQSPKEDPIIQAILEFQNRLSRV